MQPLNFEVRRLDGVVLGQLARNASPEVGDAIVVFDYPTVTRYIVVELSRRSNVLPYDLVEPDAVMVRHEEVIARSSRASRGIGLDPAKDIVARLEKTNELARKVILDRRCLDICHADFVALCEGSGLPADRAATDLFAFRGTPMTIGEEDATWNVATSFHGFNYEMCVLHVTWPGGDPFVMEPRLLEIAQAVERGFYNEDEALAAVRVHLMSKGALTIEDAVVHGIKNAISLVAEDIMDAYDAAQELVRVTRPSQIESVRAAWKASSRPMPELPAGVKLPVFLA